MYLNGDDKNDMSVTNEYEGVIFAVELNHPTLGVPHKCRVAFQPSVFHLIKVMMEMTTKTMIATTTSMTIENIAKIAKLP